MSRAVARQQAVATHRIAMGIASGNHGLRRRFASHSATPCILRVKRGACHLTPTEPLTRANCLPSLQFTPLAPHFGALLRVSP